jgi:ADP-heptose:LPS heptosyltransferase
MKILAIKWRQLGDTVLWTPALHALRQHFPTGEIHLAYPEPYAELLSEQNEFARKFFLPADKFPPYSLIRALRKEKYDWILNFHASSRSRCLALVAGGKKRLIHHHDRRGKNFGSDHPIVNLGVPMSAQERDLNVVRTLGWKGTAPPTTVVAAEKWISRGGEILGHSGRKTGRPLVLFAPFASRLAKQWPIVRYRELAGMLSEKAQVGVLYDTEAKCRELGQHFGDDVLRVVTPELSALMGVLSHADLVVGSDSGVKHLAIALGKRTVSLFGPESLGEWHGYSLETHPALRRFVACRDRDPVPPEFAWCGAVTCPLSSHACLNLISASETKDVVLKALSSL